MLAQDHDFVQHDRVRKFRHQGNFGRPRPAGEGAVLSIDLVDGPRARHGVGGANAVTTHDDIEHVSSAHSGDAGAAGGIGKFVKQPHRFSALNIDLKNLRRREGRREDLALVPKRKITQPGADRELVNDFNGQRERGIKPALAGV